MGAIRLLLTTRYIAAFTYGEMARITRHKVTHRSITRLTMGSSTPNEKTENEVAEQALSDYIASIRPKIFSYKHALELHVIKNNNTSLKVIIGGGGWRGLIWDTCIYKYSAKIDTCYYMKIMIGFAPSKLYDINGSNFDSRGWYLFLESGSTLYAENGDFDKAYSSECKVGDTITCIYNSSSSEISFEKNGVSLGVAYTNVKGEDIAPAVELAVVGESITLSAISNQY
jgi:SPRY domain